MLTLAKDAERYFRDYVRGGGKENRKKQVSRIIEFLDWVEAYENPTSLHRLGKRHVIAFWKSHRDFSEETAYKYWLGIAKLWQWIEKHEEPPAPRKGHIVETQKSSPDTDRLKEIPVAIKAARELQNLTIKQLANKSGYEATLITNIENGETDIPVFIILHLFDILKIEISLRLVSNKDC
ncbi:MAG: helix-turn-helix transcriptional regulator [Methylobacter sp.]|jgi:hypothetical protein